MKHLEKPQSYSLRGFTVHDLGRPSAPLGLTRWAQERALARALDQHGPFDLIHGFYADPAGQLAARAGRRLKIPSVVTCDSGEFVSIATIKYGSQRTSRGRRAVSEACTLATKVHVCTSFMAALAALENIVATVIPLTSVTSQAATIKWPVTRRQPDTFRIVQVASLSRVKNQRLLIDALPIVREKIDARLDLVGEDTLSGELQKHAGKIGVGAHVTFHGFLPQPRVLDILSRSDLYVQTSLHEAAGVSVLEAAACRRADARNAGRLRGRLVADESDGAGRRDPRVARRCDPHLARGSRSPPIDGRARADVRDRARRDVVRGAVRQAVSELEVLGFGGYRLTVGSDWVESNVITPLRERVT